MWRLAIVRHICISSMQCCGWSKNICIEKKRVQEQPEQELASCLCQWFTTSYFRIFNQKTFQNCRKAKVLLVKAGPQNKKKAKAACIAHEIWAQIMNRRHVKGLTSPSPALPTQPQPQPQPQPQAQLWAAVRKKKTQTKWIKRWAESTLISRKSSSASSSSDPLIWFLWLCAKRLNWTFFFFCFERKRSKKRLKSKKFFHRARARRVLGEGRWGGKRVKWSTPNTPGSLNSTQPRAQL